MNKPLLNFIIGFLISGALISCMEEIGWNKSIEFNNGMQLEAFCKDETSLNLFLTTVLDYFDDMDPAFYVQEDKEILHVDLQFKEQTITVSASMVVINLLLTALEEFEVTNEFPIITLQFQVRENQTVNITGNELGINFIATIL